MRRALPAALLTATGLAALLRVQQLIDATPPGPDLPAGEPAPVAGDAVTGPAVTTPYGAVQVAARLRDGHLDDVRALRAPDDNPQSQRINAQALPVLQREALAAQSARIDTVAGATFTSEAYRSSLQAAIDAAGTAPPGTAPAPTTTAGPAPAATTVVTTRPAPVTARPGGPAPTAAVTTTTGPAPPTTAPAPAPGGPAGPPAGPTTFAVGPVVPIATGPVQAWVAVSGGRITQVQVLQYPTGNPTSASVNAGAVPRLIDAVLTAQSARGVAAVSGATLTSEAFRQSLQAALDRAGFAG